jgi:hypothetical protein
LLEPKPDALDELQDAVTERTDTEDTDLVPA